MGFWRRIGREPLLYFLLLGVLLFAVDARRRADAPVPSADDTTITVTADAQQRLRQSWFRQHRRPPTEAEWQALIDREVRETVLYREALAMGLDEGDVIVRRRLAQKMAFLAEDLTPLPEPTEAQLTDWYRRHTGRYREPPRYAFTQLYVSPDRHGDAAGRIARERLARLTAGVDNPLSLGDPFLIAAQQPLQSQPAITRLLGPDFAEALADLPAGEWAGPVRSGHGWHLVRVREVRPARQPPLDAVREVVRRDWEQAQRKRRQQAFYERLRQRYTVIVEGDNEPREPPAEAAGE